MNDNWYIILDLEFDPPEEDEKKISDKIEEKYKIWSRNKNDPKNGKNYSKWLDNVHTIKKDMLGEEQNRAEIALDARKQRNDTLDVPLKMIGLQGHITEEEEANVAKKCHIPIEAVEKRARELGIKRITGKNYDSIYDTYYTTKPKSCVTYDGMDSDLTAFHVDNLYEFLFQGTSSTSVTNLPYQTLLDKSSEKKKNEFYKNNSISSIGADLCSRCESAFKDDASKEIYDTYLEYRERRKILKEILEISRIANQFSSEMPDAYILKLTKNLKDRSLAQDLFTAFCKKKDISFSTAVRNNIQVCRCGCTNDISDGRSVCNQCGMELHITCPQCSKKNPNNTNICTCSFDLKNIGKSIALTDLAEIELHEFRLFTAKKYIENAERLWNGNKKVEELRGQISSLEGQLTPLLEKIQNFMKNKEFYAAKAQYQKVQIQIPKFLDVAMESEISSAIVQADTYYQQAKRANSPKDIQELSNKVLFYCQDYPGITELMPPPSPVKGFRVEVNNQTRGHIIHWLVSSDHSIQYVVVKSETAWIEDVSKGEIIYQGSASSFVDKSIMAAKPYYYNVFAQRGGVYSQGAEGIFQEAVNFFEIKGVNITAASGSLKLTWSVPPSNGTVEIYEVSEDHTERHITSQKSNSYLYSDLINEKNYKFRVALSYTLGNKIHETTGVTLSGTPIIPLDPIDTLRIQFLENDCFQATWEQKYNETVVLYSATSKPPYQLGDTVSVTEIEKNMLPLQQTKIISSPSNDGKQGCEFHHGEKSCIFVIPVVVKSGTAVIGNVVRTSVVDDITITSIAAVNGKITILLTPPTGATGFVVLYRLDTYPTGISDTFASKTHLSMEEFALYNAIILPTLTESSYYFLIFAEYGKDHFEEFSSGTKYLFDNSPKIIIHYSFKRRKNILNGTSFLHLTFQSNSSQFDLPNIDIFSKIGGAPISREAGHLFYSVPEVQVDGKLSIKIPLAKDIDKNLHLRAFIHDEKLLSKYQLSLQVNSNDKIT